MVTPPPDPQRLQRREIPALPPAERLSSVPAWLLSLLLHVGLLTTLSMLWVASPKGTGDEPDRPVGVAMVYQTSGGEAYFLDTSGAASVGDSQDTAPAEQTAQSLPAADNLSAATEALLAGLLPESGQTASDPAGAAGGLGLADGGAAIGGDRSIPKVKTTVFGIEGEGTRFVYVFDRSASMLGYGGAPLRSAKAELIESLQSIGPAHQFQVIFYNDSPLPMGGLSGGPPRLFKGDERSKERGIEFVRNISADGGTEHIGALQMGLNLGPDVLFFLTDADSSPSARAIQRLQDRAVRAGTTLHAIQFGSGPSRDGGGWIRDFAEGCGGKFRYVDVSRL